MKYTEEISLLEKKHEFEMEKLRFVRRTELLILEKQWELNHSQPRQHYPQDQPIQSQIVERQLSKEELEDEDYNDEEEEQDKYEKSKKQFNKKEAKK